MDSFTQNGKVACCVSIEVQHATFNDSNATPSATPTATDSLKALAEAVLARNALRNTNATTAENQCNFMPQKSNEKLHGSCAEIDGKKILDWLSHIGETDQDMIDETLSRCTGNPETLAYFLMRSEEVPLQIDKSAVITFRYCRHFKSFNHRGGGTGTCDAGVMPSGACWWADTIHPCDQYQINQ